MVMIQNAVLWKYINSENCRFFQLLNEDPSSALLVAQKFHQEKQIEIQHTCEKSELFDYQRETLTSKIDQVSIHESRGSEVECYYLSQENSKLLKIQTNQKFKISWKSKVYCSKYINAKYISINFFCLLFTLFLQILQIIQIFINVRSSDLVFVKLF